MNTWYNDIKPAIGKKEFADGNIPQWYDVHNYVAMDHRAELKIIPSRKVFDRLENALRRFMYG